MKKTMWLRIIGMVVAMVVMRQAQTPALKNLTSSQIDDLLQRLASDRDLPVWARALAKAPWVYSQSPIDLIPDAIPVIGKVDDKVLTSIALSVLSRLSPRPAFEAHVEAVSPGSSGPA